MGFSLPTTVLFFLFLAELPLFLVVGGGYLLSGVRSWTPTTMTVVLCSHVTLTPPHYPPSSH
ncbi:hypothetical protein Hanom_Chr10g00931951 [Helianthus anomalus]